MGTKEKITEYERQNLNLAGNLSDAQVYLPLTLHQLAVVTDQRFFLASRQDFSLKLEKQRFLDVFAAFHGGLHLPPAEQMLFIYSASMAIEIVANVLRCSGRKRLRLMCPTFDASYFTAVRHGLEVIPFDEIQVLEGNVPWRTVGSAPPDAVLLTLPNNPTGKSTTARTFEKICLACRDDGVALIIDCCFRAYEDTLTDHYKIIEATGVCAAVIEDTGKLFFVKDLKLGMLWASTHWSRAMLDVHRDFILEVPLISLVTLSRLLEVSGPAYRSELRAIVQRNRVSAKSVLAAYGLTALGGEDSNVQLFELPAAMSALALARKATDLGVGIVAADGYFWAHPSRDAYIRLALARTDEEFSHLLGKLTDVFNLLKGTPDQH